MKQNEYPPGWDEERVQKVIDYYENQTEDEAVAEDEEAFRNEFVTKVGIPMELVSTVRELISKRKQCGFDYDEKNDIENAIKDHRTAIQLKPDLTAAYATLGIIRLLQQKWSEAKIDLTVANNSGVDIIAIYNLFYDDVEDFEKQNNVQLPKDLAVMLKQTVETD